MAHKFEDKDGTSGTAFTMMAWINCVNSGGSWANIWHISPKTHYNSRNPALYVNVGSRYLMACFTNMS